MKHYEQLINKIKLRHSKRNTMLLAILILGIAYLLLPLPRFSIPTSTVLNDKDGVLLSARIASDGQWRFPQGDSIPEKFEQAILHFEDQYFYKHIGFNPISMVRAIRQNIAAGKVVSGGSTLSMQVVRLSRPGKPRSIWEKTKEIILSTRLELSKSKKEILGLYAANAPFGGNIVGLETASWRYFGRSAHALSWAESAVLAVLPNQPALIFPGKNQDILKSKRDFLLNKLYDNQVIDSLTLILALDEPLPGKPFPLPQLSNHLMDKAIKDGHKGKLLNTSIDINLQQQVNEILNRHSKQLEDNEIHNAAAIILSVQDNNVLSYVGNVSNGSSKDHGRQVDIITAKRSTGSILKPILYGAMLDEGSLLPGHLIPDIPTFIQGFAPKNFTETYEGAVSANKALARSLNIPAVRMLQSYGINKFHDLLKNYGITSLTQPASHYGLSLILGGAEASLWDITSMYAQTARTLKHYFRYAEPKRYHTNDLSHPYYLKALTENPKKSGNRENSLLSAGTIWSMAQAMLEVYRPGENASWRYFESSQKIAWKTGTSYGFRDGWAVGFTPDYVVGVWVGNADGEGRPGLTGIKTAGPILFDIFDFLPKGEWFEKPNSDLVEITVCSVSGFRKNQYCPNTETVLSVKNGLSTAQCSFHQLIHLDATETFRVNGNCEAVQNIVQKPWFVLPPVQAYYYKTKSSLYQKLPPLRPDCQLAERSNEYMQVIFPKKGAKLLIPRALNGQRGQVIFEVAHNNDTEIYWHLDDNFLQTTKGYHQVGLSPDKGEHVLTLIDANGQMLKHNFEILGTE